MQYLYIFIAFIAGIISTVAFLAFVFVKYFKPAKYVKQSAPRSNDIIGKDPVGFYVKFIVRENTAQIH